MKRCILTVEALNLLPCWKKEAPPHPIPSHPTPPPPQGVWDPGVQRWEKHNAKLGAALRARLMPNYSMTLVIAPVTVANV